MKSLMSMILILVLISPIGLAKAGGSGTGTSGGGNEVEIEVASLRFALFDLLSRNCERISELVLKKNECLGATDSFLRRVLNTLAIAPVAPVAPVRVEVVTFQLKDNWGRERTALNFPDLKLIQIQSEKWQGISSRAEKLALLAHEFAEVVSPGVDDLYYAFSRVVFELAAEEERSIGTVWFCRVTCGSAEPTAVVDQGVFGEGLDPFSNQRAFSKAYEQCRDKYSKTWQIGRLVGLVKFGGSWIEANPINACKRFEEVK